MVQICRKDGKEIGNSIIRRLLHDNDMNLKLWLSRRSRRSWSDHVQMDGPVQIQLVMPCLYKDLEPFFKIVSQLNCAGRIAVDKARHVQVPCDNRELMVIRVRSSFSVHLRELVHKELLDGGRLRMQRLLCSLNIMLWKLSVRLVWKLFKTCSWLVVGAG